MNKTYDFKREAQRVIEAIEPKHGATMTIMCALLEAFAAGQCDALAARDEMIAAIAKLTPMLSDDKYASDQE